jgi:hypothetical protein
MLQRNKSQRSLRRTVSSPRDIKLLDIFAPIGKLRPIAPTTAINKL